MTKQITKTKLKKLIYQVTGASIEVHKALGPGLLEKVYHKCLLHELRLRKIDVQTEMSIPVNYKGLDVEAELRCDLLVG